MASMHKHLVLIGFKHVGKSAIGKFLAHTLNIPFNDLDIKIEHLFEEQFKQNLNCRDIMKNYGENFFREIETQALFSIIQNKPSVISLGGGTPLIKQNQNLIRMGQQLRQKILCQTYFILF